MKKIIAMILALTLLLALCGCDSGEKPQQTDPAATNAPVETTAAAVETTVPQETEAPAVIEEPFGFAFEGALLIPGTVYDASMLPEPTYVYQVPSCAIEGTDNVYSFDTVEITAFNDGTQEIIYAIAIFDPNICTDEGLYLGDDTARVIELYGEDYEMNGTAMVYTRGNTMLTIILQDDYVVDMEFKWITE